MGVEVGDINLLKEQILYVEGLKENRRWNLQHGAMNTGKTFLDCLYTIPKALRENRGGVVIFIGPEKQSIETNVFSTMNEMYDMKLSRKTKSIYGKTIALSGARKRDIGKLNFENIDFIYGDEIGAWDEDFLKYIEGLSKSKGFKIYGTMTADKDAYVMRDYILNLEDVFELEYTSIKNNNFLYKPYVDSMVRDNPIGSKNSEWISSWE